jgi:hypothetical protein
MIKVKNTFTWDMAMPVLIDGLKSGNKRRVQIAEDELLRLAKELDALNEPTKIVQHKPKKRKKRLVTCTECGKVCRGKKGLMIHKARLHGYRSPNYENNKRYRETGVWSKKQPMSVALLKQFD